jgi:rhodanese-related sulfurtransferase
LKVDSSGRGRVDRGQGVWPSVVFQGAVVLTLAVLIGLTVNQVRRDGIPLVGDWSPKGRISGNGSGDGALISIEEARVLFETNEALFLDARSPRAYRSGHIQGALSLPWEEFEARFEEIMEGIPADYPIVTYCDGESCGLSKDLASALSARGYVNVRVLPDGWSAWKQAKLPVEGG